MNLSKSSLNPTQTLYLSMTLQTSPLRAFLTQARIQKVLSLKRVLLLSSAASRILALSSGCHVLHGSAHSRRQAPYVVVTALSQCCWSTMCWCLGSTLASRIFGGGLLSVISGSEFPSTFLTWIFSFTATCQTWVGLRHSGKTISPAYGLWWH